jgi:AI-2 transport protein TqsA
LLGIYIGLNMLVGSSLTLFLKDVQQHNDDLKAVTQSTGQIFSKKGLNIPVLSEAGSLEPAKIMHYTGLVVGKIREVISQEITFIFVSIFLMAELEIVRLKIRIMTGGSEESMAYVNSIFSRIRHYLSIKTVTSLATGILVSAGLAILGVDYPLLWGLLAFLLNYIPTVGSIVAAIPGITFSILQLGFPASTWAIILYLVVNLVIGNVVEPKIMGRGMGLSTTVVFLSLIFWGFILGPVGMFLSVPITMAIKIILEHHPSTHWIAVLLGSRDDVLHVLNPSPVQGPKGISGIIRKINAGNVEK